MGDDRVERRAVLVAGAALLTALAGCGRLFIEPETTPGSDGRTATATDTPTATPAPTPRGTPTPTPAPLSGDVLDIHGRRLSLETSTLEEYTYVGYRFDVENVGERTIEYVEFRIDVRYEHEELSRVVGSDYPRFRFDPSAEEDDGGESDRGLQPDETDPVSGRLRFERDGRAERSTDASRFSLELSARRIRYR